MHKRSVHCFQLDIRKKIFRIFRIFKKHPIPRGRWLIYSTKYFFTEVKCLEKKFMVKKLLKNLHCSNCDLWPLQKYILENSRIWVIWALKTKALHWCSWKYLFTYGRHIPKTSKAEKNLQKVSFSNFDLWSICNQHSWKQQNLSYLSPKETITSLVLLNLPYYVRETNI